MKTVSEKRECYVPTNNKNAVANYILFKKVSKIAIEKGIDPDLLISKFGDMSNKRMLKLLNNTDLI